MTLGDLRRTLEEDHSLDVEVLEQFVAVAVGILGEHRGCQQLVERTDLPEGFGRPEVHTG